MTTTYANGFDWKHGLYTLGGFGAAACMWLASDQGHATALALHISAAGLAGGTFAFGYITRSLALPSKPPVVVAVSDTAGLPARVIPSTPVQP